MSNRRTVSRFPRPRKPSVRAPSTSPSTITSDASPTPEQRNALALAEDARSKLEPLAPSWGRWFVVAIIAAPGIVARHDDLVNVERGARLLTARGPGWQVLCRPLDVALDMLADEPAAAAVRAAAALGGDVVLGVDHSGGYAVGRLVNVDMSRPGAA